MCSLADAQHINASHFLFYTAVAGKCVASEQPLGWPNLHSAEGRAQLLGGPTAATGKLVARVPFRGSTPYPPKNLNGNDLFGLPVSVPNCFKILILKRDVGQSALARPAKTKHDLASFHNVLSAVHQ